MLSTWMEQKYSVMYSHAKYRLSIISLICKWILAQLNYMQWFIKCIFGSHHYTDTELMNKSTLCPQKRPLSMFKNHRDTVTVEMLSRETRDFISPLHWPPNSPDLNPVDYAIFGQLKERVYHTRSVTSTTSLSKSWRNGPDLTMRSSVLQLLSGARLRACAKADGGHFEHFFIRIIDEWSHCFIGDKCRTCIVRVVTETCVFDV